MKLKTYTVRLTDAEREKLTGIIRKGHAKARVVRRAHILLHAADDTQDTATAAALRTSVATVQRTRQRFFEQGLDAALTEKPRPGQAKKLNAKQETELTAIACSAPPKGRACWTSELLALELVKKGVVTSIGTETVRLYLKKTVASRGSRRCGASES